MAEMRGNSNNKKRLSIDLSIFANTTDYIYTVTKSPKNFEEPNGVVGLGIVAAMDVKAHEGPQDPNFTKSKAAIFAVSPRSSSPIPISSQRNNFVVKKSPSFEDMEMCEEYTCVISHVGNNLVKKREYFDGDFLGFSEGKKFAAAAAAAGGATTDGGAANGYWMSSGMVSGSSAVAYGGTANAAEGWTADFLNSCFLCKKKLHGLDIFMYRGDKAFCSAECRYKQISVDEHKEKCGSGVIKPTEYSVSPCSGPMHCFAGVAAA